MQHALVAEQAPGLTPVEVRDIIVEQSTKNIIKPTTLNGFHTMNSHLLFSRVVVPDLAKGKKGPKVPCTPKRQRAGECQPVL